MSFINPLFLYGLFALAIPILIHLFNLRKTKKVYFSNTRFLRMAKEASARKRKLKHYLILLSRLFFIFFLVLAFAQPFLPASEENTAGHPIIVYLDNSFSMSNEVEEGLTAFEQGVDFVSTLTELMPEGSRFRLITNDFSPGSESLESANEIQERLTEITYSGNTRSYDDIYRRIHSFQEEYKNINLFWLSDFQQSTADQEPLPAFTDGEKTQLVPLRFQSVKNVYIDSIYLENPLLIGDEKLKLFAIIRNAGADEVNDLIVKVFLDQVQSATASVNLPANGNATVEFDLAFTVEQEKQGRISIEEFPVTFDNDFYFTLSKPERINVLEIKESEVRTPVESVFGNQELFQFNSYSSDNLDYNLINISALVVVNGIEELDAPLATALNRYQESGGHILIIPSARPMIQSYRQVFGLQDVQLLDSVGSLSLEVPDFNNPFYANIFEERNTRMEMPRAEPVITWRTDGTSLLRFASGTPFLTQRKQDGIVYLMSSPLTPDYNGFIRHALYVPVMYKIAAGSLGEGRQLYRYMDESTFSLPAGNELTGELYRLQREDLEIIPQQRRSGNSVFFDIPSHTLEAGFYTLFQGQDTVGIMAFNYAPEESDLRQLDDQSIRNIFQGQNISLLEIDDSVEFQKTMEDRFIGRNLWKLMVIFALLALLSEAMIIRFMS
jgi:hypothetical protein